MSFLFPSQPKIIQPPPAPAAPHSPNSPAGTASSFLSAGGRPSLVPSLGTIASLARKPANVTKRSLYSIY